ncbi:MAG: type I-G CRISPR-associated protein Cas8g1/Csx17 [Acidimicrobiales bacterium]
MSMHTHHLFGCRSEPLASYLKALGILRIVALQADSQASAFWDASGFVLETALDADGLTQFLGSEYRPTPVVTPWNKGSGFVGAEGKDGLNLIERSTDERLAAFRSSIAIAREVLELAKDEGWPKKEMKEKIVTECRSRLPDEALDWLDAAVVVTADGRSAFPPLLGTGGNVGRLEISRNFHENLVRVLGLNVSKRDDAASWLEDALFDTGNSKRVNKSASQFDPGAAGGANSAQLGRAPGVLNPWDFVLGIEGALMFAGSAARRLASGAHGVAAAPFMASSSACGYASSSADEDVKGELWAPLWERPATFPELRRLFAEGRADWKRHHARNGLELAKAAASLGVDRGLSAFSRSAFIVRNGQNPIALPAGRVEIKGRPAARPLEELDTWLNRVRSAQAPPAAVSVAMREVDRLSFAVASGQAPRGLLSLLVEVAKLEEAVGRATQFQSQRNGGISPVGDLHASTWVRSLAECDWSPEFRLALALASARDVHGSSGRTVSSLRTMLRPVTPPARSKQGRVEWSGNPPLVPGMGVRPVVSLLADVHARRAVDLLASQRGSQERDPNEVGLPTRWQFGYLPHLEDINRLVLGNLDEVRLSSFLAALILLNWDFEKYRGTLPKSLETHGSEPGTAVIPPALAVLGPFFAEAPRPEAIKPGNAWDEKLQRAVLRPEASWPALLAADRTIAVLRAAYQRLRIAGVHPITPAGRSVGAVAARGAGPRLGAALLCRIGSDNRLRLLHRCCPEPPETGGSPQDTSVNSDELTGSFS